MEEPYHQFHSSPIGSSSVLGSDLSERGTV